MLRMIRGLGSDSCRAVNCIDVLTLPILRSLKRFSMGSVEERQARRSGVSWVLVIASVWYELVEATLVGDSKKTAMMLRG